MNKIKTFIVAKHYLITRGLMYCIKQILPEPDLEIVDIAYLLNNEFTESAVLLLQSDDLTDDELKKIRHNYRKGKMVAILENYSNQQISDMFIENLNVHDPEEVFIRKLREVYTYPEAEPGAVSLSQREKEILKGVALGYSNKEIAEKLFISPNTVITHRKNITSKLGIKSIAGLTVYAVLNGIISMDEIGT